MADLFDGSSLEHVFRVEREGSPAFGLGVVDEHKLVPYRAVECVVDDEKTTVVGVDGVSGLDLIGIGKDDEHFCMGK